MSYTDFGEKMLIALYQEAEEKGAPVTFKEVTDKYGLPQNLRWIEKLTNEWEANGLVDVDSYIGSPLRWHAEISGYGLREVERRYGGKDGVGTIIEPVTGGHDDEATTGASPSRYKDFSNQFLVAAYHESRLRPDETIRSGAIIDSYQLVFEPGWVVQLVRDLGVRGYFTSKGVDSDDRGQPIRLTGRGLRAAEDLIEGGLEIRPRVPSEIPSFDEVETVDAGNRENSAPASDRIVRFDHNLPGYKAIRDGIAEVREAIRGANDLEAEERDRLNVSLEAAQSLWQAAQLKIVQIKVGIILTLEDAAKALSAGAKVVAAALLVDTIKAFIKTHVGIDLDHL